MKMFKGCGTALVTPFDSSLEVDYPALRVLIRRQLDAGIDFLVPLGTTGETPCLDESEKEKLLETVMEENNGRVPVVAGAGSNCTRKVVSAITRLSRYNPDAFLVVVPYYNKPSQEGIFQHFKTVADSSPAPLILYNVPGRTGVNMTAETTLRLAEIENIVAIKEASNWFEQISEIIRLSPDNFTVLSGNDDMTLPIMSAGAKGVISVASNILPAPVTRMTRLLLKGRNEEALLLHHRLMPLFTGCFVEANPIPVKAALAALGLIENRVRLPLTSSCSTTDTTMEKLIAETAEL